MKTMVKALAVWIALAGMAQANEPAASQDQPDETGTVGAESACDTAETQAAAASGRFARAAELASRECAKPDWSWQD